MSFCLRSWLTGFALGLSGKPYPYSKRQPTAYLYNGVKLPALPEWDVGAYPYAYILLYQNYIDEDGVEHATYYLYLSTVPLAFHAYVVIAHNLCAKESGQAIAYTVTDEGQVWERSADEDKDITAGEYVKISISANPKWVWCNSDMYYCDDVEDKGGTIFLSASDPVPIYE